MINSNLSEIIHSSSQENVDHSDVLPSIHNIIWAYVRARDHKKIEEYRIKYPYSVQSIARCYALAKEHEKVEEYRVKHQASVHEIAKAYAGINDHEKANEYRVKHQASVHEIAKGYGYRNNHDKVEEYRIYHKASVHEIVRVYAFSNNHEKVEEYRFKHQASVHEIARGYAAANNHELVETYRIQYHASVHEIAKGYATANNHEFVEAYRMMHHASIDEIARGYAFINNPEKVEEYRAKHQASVHEIARSYAEANNHEKVEEYRCKYGASRHSIARGYARANNHKKVKEYIKNHQASLEEIIKGYDEANSYEKVKVFREKYQVFLKKTARNYIFVDNYIEPTEFPENQEPLFLPELTLDIHTSSYIDLTSNHYPPPYTFSHGITTNYVHTNADSKEEWSSNYQALEDTYPNNSYQSTESLEKYNGLQEERSENYAVNNNALNVEENLKNAEVVFLPEIKGGIHTKYITDSPHARLPTSLNFFQNKAQSVERQILTFISINSLSRNHSSYYSFPFNSKTMEAKFLTLNKLDKSSVTSESWTFICAGRKSAALVPNLTKGRCVLICTENEREELEPYISAHVDLLVISTINSEYYGAYTQLNSITARRIATFLFAYHLDLNEFAMLDDNIKTLSWEKESHAEESWDNLFNFLKSGLTHKGSLSVATLDGRVKAKGELGSKFFMINMGLIRTVLTNDEQFFLLFPDAAQANKWGEDYYFQIFLHHLLADINSTGYEILPLKQVGLTRSKSNRNAFAKTGKKAEKFSDITALRSIPANLQMLIYQTVSTLNAIIENNYKQHTQKDTFLQEVNLFDSHAAANNQRVDKEFQLTCPENIDSDFKAKFHYLINQYDFKTTILRDYQVQAIQSVTTLRQSPARLVMATASGKSIIQATMALFAYHASENTQRVFIVTPQIELVIQFYRDFIKYNHALKKSNNPLYVPPQVIVTVSSHSQSLSVNALLKNEHFKQHKAIVICCEDSFVKLFNQQEQLISGASLLLLDEYHEYSSTVETICRELEQKEPLIIASSATPPKKDFITETLYSFGLNHALNGPFHAPISIGCFDLDYSKDNVEWLIKCLPQILKHQYHPGFGEPCTLAEKKGIIFLESIELCEQMKKKLMDSGINAHAIHSTNELSTLEAKKFVESDDPGVLIAVRKLRFGFDCPDLAWVIIARKPAQKDPEQDIEQMLGRVFRCYKDKIGFVLTFRDLHNHYLEPLIEAQNKMFKLSPDFLATELEYRLTSDGKCEVVDLDLEEINEKKPGFFSKTKRNQPMELSKEEPTQKKLKLMIPAEVKKFI